jgi:hypothetical protein
MNKKLSIALVPALIVLMSSIVLAAPNPSGTGQSSQSCQAVFPTGPLMPNGFNTAGFALAGTVYAGSGASVQHANSPNAVSQYDVACYQVANK